MSFFSVLSKRFHKKHKKDGEEMGKNGGLIRTDFPSISPPGGRLEQDQNGEDL